MATINFQDIINNSVNAAKTIAGKSWNQLKPYAEHEFEQFAENIAFLAKLKLSGQVSEAEFNIRVGIQKTALKNVMLTIEGIGLIMAQDIVNAVIGIVFSAVGTAAGIVI